MKKNLKKIFSKFNKIFFLFLYNLHKEYTIPDIFPFSRLNMPAFFHFFLFCLHFIHISDVQYINREI